MPHSTWSITLAMCLVLFLTHHSFATFLPSYMFLFGVVVIVVAIPTYRQCMYFCYNNRSLPPLCVPPLRSLIIANACNDVSLHWSITLTTCLVSLLTHHSSTTFIPLYVFLSAFESIVISLPPLFVHPLQLLIIADVCIIVAITHSCLDKYCCCL